MKNKFLSGAYMLLVVAIIGWACNSDSKPDEDTEKQEQTETSNQTTEQNDNSKPGENTEHKTENDAVKVMTAKFLDAAPLERTFYYFFENESGEEVSIYHNTVENTALQMDVDLVGTDLQANPDMVGKKFKITYVEEERINDNTGDTELHKIPKSIEQVK